MPSKSAWHATTTRKPRWLLPLLPHALPVLLPTADDVSTHARTAANHRWADGGWACGRQYFFGTFLNRHEAYKVLQSHWERRKLYQQV
jgi:hypothetical protein